MKKNKLTFVVALGLSLFFIGGYARDSHAEDLREQILSSVAKQAQNKFYFSQEKKLSSLKKPLITEGELLINNNPDKGNSEAWDITWNIQKPFTMRYEIYTDHIKETDSKGERIIPSGNNPVAIALTKVMAATFTGHWTDNREDQESSLVDVSASGELSRWTLQMKPRPDDLKKIITSFVVEGAQGIIKTVVITETNGDSTTIHLKTTLNTTMELKPTNE